MPSAREINRRIKSVTNTQQITKAMKMVSSVRLRGAEERALATAPFTKRIEGMLQRLSVAMPGNVDPFFKQRDVNRVCYLIIGADKGLAGAFSSNLNKAIVEATKDKTPEGFSFIAIGRKPAEYLKHLHITPDYKDSGFSDKPTFIHAQRLAEKVSNEFLSGKYDEVYLIYTHFKTVLSQDVVKVKLLPIAQDAMDIVTPLEQEKLDGFGQTIPDKETAGIAPKASYIFTPDPETVMSTLLPQYLNMVIYNGLLQSAASELGARMTAMTSATDNAGELIEKLTVHFNKVRQAGITNELTEIVSGANALK